MSLWQKVKRWWAGLFKRKKKPSVLK